MYVSSNSNHPPSILCNIPESINQRLSNISSCKASFEEEAPHYQEALIKAGYDYKLSFTEKETNESENNMVDEEERKHGRCRNVIWFNPPYAKNISTNIGKKFITLLRKHFLPQSELYHLFNTKKVKMSSTFTLFVSVSTCCTCSTLTLW